MKTGRLIRRERLHARPWRPGAFSSLRPRSPKQVSRERNLAALKEQLIEERGPFCQVCQILWRDRTGRSTQCAMTSDGCSGMAEDLHHVLPRSLGGADTRPNLLLVGRVHHEWLETAENLGTSLRLGLLRRTSPAAAFEIERSAS